MKRQWPLVVLTCVVGLGAGVMIAGLPDEGTDDRDLVPTTTSTLPPGDEGAVGEGAGSVEERLRITVIGDSYTQGSSQGGTGSARWPVVADLLLRDAGWSTQLTVAAEGGAGYVQGGAVSELDFAGLAAGAVTADDDLVVVMGSRNDLAYSADDVRSAADAVLASIRATAPTARLVVVGPPWVDDAPPQELLDIRDTLSEAAGLVGARFVDPLTDAWFAGESAGLIGADGVHPTTVGHRHMADLMLPVLTEELAAIAPAA